MAIPAEARTRTLTFLACGMAQDVAQRLLGDPEQDRLDASAQMQLRIGIQVRLETRSREGRQ